MSKIDKHWMRLPDGSVIPRPTITATFGGEYDQSDLARAVLRGKIEELEDMLEGFTKGAATVPEYLEAIEPLLESIRNRLAELKKLEEK